MLQLRFKRCRGAEEQALVMVSMWKVCDRRKYDELVDELLAKLAQRMHTLYKIIAWKEITSSIIVLSGSSSINTALKSWNRDQNVGVSNLEIH